MNLIVDIGNTCLKIALFEKNNLIEKSHLLDNYLDNIKNILSKNPVENSIVSNVSEINDELISVLNEAGFKNCKVVKKNASNMVIEARKN